MLCLRCEIAAIVSPKLPKQHDADDFSRTATHRVSPARAREVAGSCRNEAGSRNPVRPSHDVVRVIRCGGLLQERWKRLALLAKNIPVSTLLFQGRGPCFYCRSGAAEGGRWRDVDPKLTRGSWTATIDRTTNGETPHRKYCASQTTWQVRPLLWLKFLREAEEVLVGTSQTTY